MSNDYKKSGVNLEAGNATIDKIKSVVKSTFNKNVLTGIGHFGALYELDLKGYTNPVLVSSVDGVGTKLKVAIDAGVHNTVGQDLVNHCVNDIAVCGAKPLYFMDYMAFGKLDPEVATSIVEGFAKACKENDIALIGGETAEMPGLYQDKDYDLSGTIVGLVEKENIIDGSNVEAGDILLGFKSNGLHTNGYSLARKVLFDKYSVNDKLENLDGTLSDELLKVHKSYFEIIQNLSSKKLVKSFSHITGGGIIGNTKRVVPENCTININWDSWEIPNIFKGIQASGSITDDEMRKVFNLGIGLIAIIDKNNLTSVKESIFSLGEEVIEIGEIV
ncbi:MAG: phosphoribosylformylglycinamidine cyclo-ligase [Ignavibacteriae bacterium]|nr:phosphoribosylformylglycinamidine cyclo-ligase [Ignavibacteriota bacterium]